MGGSKQTTTSNQVSTNTLPSFLTDPAQSNINWINNFNGPLTPGFNQDQLDTFGMARQFAGQGSALPGALSPINNQLQGLINGPAPQVGAFGPIQASTAGGNVAPQTFDGSTAAQYMGAYKNPYENDVVNTTLSNFDVNQARIEAANRARRDAGSAFGNRSANADAILQADMARNRAGTEAGLRSQGFQFGAQLGAGDAARMQAAAQANAQARMAADLANLQNAQFNAGAQNQATLTQAGITNQRDLANMNATQNQQGLQFAGLQQLGQNAVTADQATTNRDLQNIASLGAIGDAQYAQQAALNQDPLTLFQLRSGAVQGMAPFFGQNTTQGTQTTRTNSGLGGVLGAVGGFAGGLGMLGAGFPGMGGFFSGLANSGGNALLNPATNINWNTGRPI